MLPVCSTCVKQFSRQVHFHQWCKCNDRTNSYVLSQPYTYTQYMHCIILLDLFVALLLFCCCYCWCWCYYLHAIVIVAFGPYYYHWCYSIDLTLHAVYELSIASWLTIQIHCIQHMYASVQNMIVFFLVFRCRKVTKSHFKLPRRTVAVIHFSGDANLYSLLKRNVHQVYM